MLSPRNKCAVIVGLCLCVSFSAPQPLNAQISGGASALTNAEIQNSMNRSLTLLVSVRERNGIPLNVDAVVRVSALAGGQTLVGSTTDAATATFQGVHAGEYEVQVDAAGYETTHERVTVTGVSISTVYIYVAVAGSSAPGAKASSGTVMTPYLQHELDKSLYALQQKKFDEARKHLEKVHKMAPSNPDVLYLMGMLDYTSKDMPAARKQFEQVLAAYPVHERSLAMLGQMQLDANENKEASVTLQKAVDTGSVDWRAHYLLAVACARTGEFQKADVEANRTAELNKAKAPAMKLFQAKILLMRGKNREAEDAFNAFLREYPQDAGAAEAKSYVAKIEQAKNTAVTPASAAAASSAFAKAADTDAAAPTTAVYEKPWAPVEVDAAVPPIAPGVSCSIDDILANTQKRILQQLGDLEKFSATEQVEHQFIDAYGVPEAPVSQTFDYLIFVHHTATLPYYFDETRNGAESLYAFPSSLVTRGLVSLGFMVIHPVFSKDFVFTCEGLGTWNGKAAWQVHFTQRPDVPSRIRTWHYKKVVYPIPLKGRIWIAANSYSIVHLETGLRETVPDLKLNREQMIVDYGPVHFQSATTELWLPWHAEMYFDMMGRRYHHKHTLTNYLLFDVDTKNKIKAPPVPTEKQEN